MGADNQMSKEEWIKKVKPTWAMGRDIKPVKPKGNQRVTNAKKIKKYNLTFDSALELYAFEKFISFKFKFDFQKKFVLQPKFNYRGETVRMITWTADFFFEKENVIIDTKGWATDIFKLKIRMVKYYLSQMENPPIILIPKNKSEVDRDAMEILSMRSTSSK